MTALVSGRLTMIVSGLGGLGTSGILGMHFSPVQTQSMSGTLGMGGLGNKNQALSGIPSERMSIPRPAHAPGGISLSSSSSSSSSLDTLVVNEGAGRFPTPGKPVRVREGPTVTDGMLGFGIADLLVAVTLLERFEVVKELGCVVREVEFEVTWVVVTFDPCVLLVRSDKLVVAFELDEEGIAVPEDKIDTVDRKVSEALVILLESREEEDCVAVPEDRVDEALREKFVYADCVAVAKDRVADTIDEL